MASAPAGNQLPLFYKDLVPLNSQNHGNYRLRGLDSADFVAEQHFVPVTSDEIVLASRHFPVIFSAGDNPVPLALMGLNEGVNIFMEDGKFTSPVYLPAYVRRYPFILLRLQADKEDLSLCFDPTAEAVGEFDDGEKLFEDGKPTETTQQILKFCEDFERAGQRTAMFVDELKKRDLLMESEVKIEQPGMEKPYVYQGFKIVNEDKLKALPAEDIKAMVDNGMLPIIHAHMFSLQIMREVFAQQVKAGKLPQVTEAPTVEGA